MRAGQEHVVAVASFKSLDHFCLCVPEAADLRVCVPERGVDPPTTHYGFVFVFDGPIVPDMEPPFRSRGP